MGPILKYLLCKYHITFLLIKWIHGQVKFTDPGGCIDSREDEDIFRTLVNNIVGEFLQWALVGISFLFYCNERLCIIL